MLGTSAVLMGKVFGTLLTSALTSTALSACQQPAQQAFPGWSAGGLDEIIMNEIQDIKVSKISKVLVGLGLSRRASIMSFAFSLLFLTIITVFLIPNIVHQPENAPLILGYFILPLGILVALTGWLALSRKWKAQLIAAQNKESQARQFNEESQTRKAWRFLQTAMACWGCHVGLSILIASILVFVDTIDISINILTGSMKYGWLPISVILFPLFYRKMN